MTDEQEREIRLSISESELHQLLEELTEAKLFLLAVRVKATWLDEPEIKTNDAQLAKGLQTIRNKLFNLKGYLEATGFPRAALDWVEEAIEAVTSLQTIMGEK